MAVSFYDITGQSGKLLTPTEEKTMNATAHCCSFGS